MSSAPTRVFISYSHDSPAHMDQVLRLSDRLRADGIDCLIDQYEVSPAEGWPNWCMNQVKDSEFVITICTETYERRFSGKEQAGRGRGVTFEGYVIAQSLYDEQCKNEKFIPTIFSAADSEHIPTLLRGPSIYDLSGPQGYELLYRRLTNQPLATKPELGQVKSMPPRTTPPLSRLQRKQEFLTPTWNVPLPRNPFFTGRESILEEVARKFGSSKRVALNGMRGVGKTQIAAHYAHLHRREHQDVLWARAESRETLVADLVSIARLLGLPQKEEKDQSVIVVAVKDWLEANGGWLLILDNADELALVREFVPLTHSGHFLLTTTALALGGTAERVPVDEMREDEGALLLLRRARVLSKDSFLDAASSADQELARNLARELGRLPLALDQAGAYIEETPSTIGEYRELYAKEGKRLRKERGELSPDHPSVTVTFSLAFSELIKRDPVAGDLVRICAFLAPDAIPEEVLTKGASEIGEEFAHRIEEPLGFAATVKQAAKFSLIRRDTSDRSLDIHRLVQEVLKDDMNANQLREWAGRAVQAVNLPFPAVDFADWTECERLVPHSKACLTLVEQLSLKSREAGRLLSQTGLYLKERAQFNEAELFYRRALSTYEDTSGPDDRNVATALSNLALLYKAQDRDIDAVPLLERAVEISQKKPDFPQSDAATYLSNLASLYDDQGDLARAEHLFQQALNIHEKIHGKHDLMVVADISNLGVLYTNQGRFVEAEPLLERALAITEGSSSPQDPTLATCLNNLAFLHERQERLGDAERLYQRSLAIREKALGPAHPALAISLNNLAGLYSDQQRCTEAEPLYQRALTILEKVFGPEHSKVANILSNYASLLRKTGQQEKATLLAARFDAIREKIEKQNKH